MGGGTQLLGFDPSGLRYFVHRSLIFFELSDAIRYNQIIGWAKHQLMGSVIKLGACQLGAGPCHSI